MSDPSASPGIMHGQRFAALTLLDGSVVRPCVGHLVFVSDGAVCMYPRFVDVYGMVYPWSSVLVAEPVNTARWDQ